MRLLIRWLDENLLFFTTGLLLAFLPLYPKLPLFEAIPGYIVRIRLEDFFVTIILLIWLIQLWRKKVSFGPNPIAKPILAYVTVGILSMISAVFVTQTVPLESLHIEKMVLHYLRRLEYFSLFFVFYSTVKSLRHVKIYVGIIVMTVIGITIYGYGQKYLYWPAFSTMNREFSKGWALYLTQHARVLSTFGGHYDLAAYTMAALILLWALYFSIENKLLKTLLILIIAGAFWLLILTASRTSFIAYIAGITLLFIFWIFRQGIKWALTRWFIVVSLSIIVMLSFGDLSDRFLKLLKLDARISGIKSLLLRPIGAPPNSTDIVFLENNLEAVTSKSDYPPIPVRPTDVFTEDIDGLIATQSASGAATLVKIPRSYSRTALVYDLSTGIRLDALWPRAVKGFLRNPLLGTGYSTLTKTQINEFTEAESTDNDYLRALGETGLLGLVTFGWILFSILLAIRKTFIIIKDKLMSGLLISLAAIIVGLLVNAVYIDIFEASKVAFSFWAIVGIILGGVKIFNTQQSKGNNKLQIPYFKAFKNESLLNMQKVLKNYRTYLILILILAYILRMYRINEPLADWHSWRQADTSAVTRNYVRYGINPLYPRYDDLSSIASGKPNPEGYRFVEFPFYNIISVFVDKLFPGYNVERSGRLTSVFFSLGTLVYLFYLTKKYFSRRTAYLTSILFAIIPYNIYWSRVVLPEPTLVFLTTSMLYYYDKWIETKQDRFWLYSLLLSSLALLVKFTAIFFVIPLLYLTYKRWGVRLIRLSTVVYFVLMVVPFFAWRWHISRFPEGIPAYTWLLNGNGIRFKGAWFWWLFHERIAKLILGSWGTFLFVLGLIGTNKASNKIPSWFFHFWLMALIMYLIVFATGNVQHDYYQIILMPIICIFLASGIEHVLVNRQFWHKKISLFMLGIVVVFMLMFGWYQVRDFYNINHWEIVEAGQEFDRKIDNRNVKVIAPYQGDTALLYQTGRRGWPIVEGTIEELIKKGAHYYVGVNYDVLTNELINISEQVEKGLDIDHKYKIISLNDKFVIIQLVSDKLLPPK